MIKFTIQQLQQMRESEDRVEFKAGEGGNVSYDGRGKTNDTVNVPINVPINASDLSIMFNVSEKTIKRDLNVLRDLNLIKYVGSNKTGHWEVIR